MSGYPVPAGPVEVTYEIKKSRFIARAACACSRAQALALLARAEADYPDARHHCWGYVIGPPQSPRLVAFSDAGEPGGTAGRPILNVLSHKGVGDIMLIVSRYFGGIKLGAGGLVRAYSSAAQLAMDALATECHQALAQFVVAGGYALEQPLRHWLAGHGGELLGVDYAEAVRFALALPEESAQALAEFVAAQGARLID